MKGTTVSLLLIIGGITIIGCSADQLPTSPTRTGTAAHILSKSASDSDPEVPIRGECTTQIEPIPPEAAGACALFVPRPSAFIRITGRCGVTHLGRTEVAGIQQLLFQLDGTGQPVIVGGQPVVTELRNCATLTAANGDSLRHTTTGTVAPGGSPSEVTFAGHMEFVEGTGRFASASGSASFSGQADILANTGKFSFNGVVAY